MEDKYLLYVDILGFSELVDTNPKLIEDIFLYLDKNQFFRNHSSLKSIVFSDTLLFFNKNNIENRYMYALIGDMLEFCQLLMWHFAPFGIFFRGLITFGQFEYKELANGEYYFGKALIKAYKDEKDFSFTGIAIDKKLEKFNRYYKTTHWNDHYNYVFLTNSIIRSILKLESLNMLVIENNTSQAGFINREIMFLKSIYNHLCYGEDAKIKQKHETTWDLYKSILKNISDDLVEKNFQLKEICDYIDIESELKDFHYFD
jgi:hypothetical protein